MSDVERYGVRDLTPSHWHREESMRRFLPAEQAHELAMIDLDAIEYCRRCGEPLLLIELAKDVGQSFKSTTVMRKLARMANLRAVLVFWMADEGEVVGFRVRSIHPYQPEEQSFTPSQYAVFLWSFRVTHPCYLEATA
jgi:hypothetical protein